MCRAEFVDYANKIRDYCNKLSEIGGNRSYRNL